MCNNCKRYTYTRTPYTIHCYPDNIRVQYTCTDTCNIIILIIELKYLQKNVETARKKAKRVSIDEAITKSLLNKRNNFILITNTKHFLKKKNYVCA